MIAATPASDARPFGLRRVLAGLALAAVGITCIFFPYAFYLLVLAIGVFSLVELARLCEIKGTPLEYWVAIGGVLAYILMAIFGLLHQWEGVLLAAVVLATFWLGIYGEERIYFARTAYTLLAVLYIGKLLTYFIFVRQIPGEGLWWTLYAVVLIAMTDILAMAVGSVFGRHQLTRVSPRKTIEGSLGALVLVCALGGVLAAVPQVHLLWWQGALLGAGTCIAAQAGDLVESALKRDAGVKDTGSVIQGHGGVLDRFDSYLFGGMAFFGMLHVLSLVPL